MSAKFLTIQDAAALTNKSVQTIRRAIKAKKVRAKKSKTPQGFNYMVEKESLFDAFGINDENKELPTSESTEVSVENLQSLAISSEAVNTLRSIEKQYGEVKDLFGNFNKTMQTLVEHNNQERENFYRLMKTFQDRVVMLEEHVRVLNDKGSKRWYKFWA